jgi:RNA polymerase sigma-70 factor (ECF subfamily)
VQDRDARDVSGSGMDNLDQPVVTELVRPGDVRRGLADVDSIVIAAFDAYAGRLRAFALRAVGDADAADDLVQDTFARLLVEARTKQLPDDIAAWLFRVCGNLFVSRGRRQSVARRMKALLIDRRIPTSPEEHAVRADETARLTGHLAALPPDPRVALLMSAAGYSSAEIGRAIGRTENATLSYVSRARMRLRELIALEEAVQ